MVEIRGGTIVGIGYWVLGIGVGFGDSPFGL